MGQKAKNAGKKAKSDESCNKKANHEEDRGLTITMINQDTNEIKIIDLDEDAVRRFCRV